MIKLEFPANRYDLAAIFGKALTDYSATAPAMGWHDENGYCGNDGMKVTHNPDASNTGDALTAEELEARTAEAVQGAEPGKTASSAAVQDGHAEATTHGSGDAVASGGGAETTTVDINGLAFNGLYCGVANDPFYGTGPRKGQWKKRRGVSDEEYDRWYADTRAKAATAATGAETTTTTAAAEQEQAPANTAAAFGNDTPTAEPAPQTPGEFMGWTSERQAAGLLSQKDIEDVYHENGIAVTDLFGAHDPGVVEGRIATLHGHFVALIASRGTA